MQKSKDKISANCNISDYRYKLRESITDDFQRTLEELGKKALNYGTNDSTNDDLGMNSVMSSCYRPNSQLNNYDSQCSTIQRCHGSNIMGASEITTQYKAKRPKSRLVKTSHQQARRKTEEPRILIKYESKFKENALINLPFHPANRPTDVGTTLENNSIDGEECGFNVQKLQPDFS